MGVSTVILPKKCRVPRPAPGVCDGGGIVDTVPQISPALRTAGGPLVTVGTSARIFHAARPA